MFETSLTGIFMQLMSNDNLPALASALHDAARRGCKITAADLTRLDGKSADELVRLLDDTRFIIAALKAKDQGRSITISEALDIAAKEREGD